MTLTGKYLVALSGGADSVALLLILKILGYNIEAVHCNFHLRGDESDRDEAFCKRLCEKYDLNIHVVHFDTNEYAEFHKVSIEMAARDLRYNYFEQLRKDIDAEAICVAHHRDDSVETVLINLIRGTGLNGLTGIAPQNSYVVRPLLCVSHMEIVDYLSSVKQDYVIDSTNLIDDFTRNKIRLDIIPLLSKINPSVSENIFKTANRLSDASVVFEHAMRDSIGRVMIIENAICSISIPLLKKEDAIEYTLFYILKDYGFTSAQIEQIAYNLDAESGRVWCSKTYSALIDRGRILVEPVNDDTERDMCIPECGLFVYSENEKFKFECKAIDKNFILSKSMSKVCLDFEKVSFPLTIRRTKTGDRFIPYGMNGSKLVSDYLTDRKMSLFDKGRQLVIVDSFGTIIWLVNMRPDNKFCITTTSKNALIVTYNE